MHYVYVLQQGSGGPVKIGIANDIKRRVMALNTGASIALDVLKSHEMEDASHSRLVERYLHKILDKHRLNGEWFSPEALTELPESISYDFIYGRMRAWNMLPRKKTRRIWHPVKCAYVEVEITYARKPRR